MSPVENLNDPFDSSFYADGDEFRIKSKEFKKLAELLYNVPKEKFEEVSRLELPKVIDVMIKEYQNRMRIGCFSENYNSLPMWGYYSDNYKGYCVRYNVKKILNSISENFLPVIYSEEFCNATDNLAYIDDNINITYNPVLYKGFQWKHEKEWRVFKFVEKDSQQNYYIYLDNAIDEIYIGCKCEDKNANEIIKWCREKNISVFKTKKSFNEYKLEKFKV